MDPDLKMPTCENNIPWLERTLNVQVICLHIVCPQLCEPANLHHYLVLFTSNIWRENMGSEESISIEEGEGRKKKAKFEVDK